MRYSFNGTAYGVPVAETRLEQNLMHLTYVLNYYRLYQDHSTKQLEHNGAKILLVAEVNLDTLPCNLFTNDTGSWECIGSYVFLPGSNILVAEDRPGQNC